MKKPKVFIVSSGLGNIHRGFESFFRDCFDTLRHEPELDLFLFKGKGEESQNEISLWNLPRHGKASKRFARFLGRGSYFVEQVTFFVSILPHILIKKPDVIYLSDVVLANLIRFLKGFFRCKYKVLYNNGGPTLPKFLFRWDHIQQVSPQYLNIAVQTGLSRDRQTLLPYAVNIGCSFVPIQDVERENLRKKLGLPLDRKIILSVGAINRSRKRMDYLVGEVAKMQKPRPFLLLIGQNEPETEDIINLGKRFLSHEGFSARTVAKEEVGKYYKVADLFTLASLDEGFGLVYVEAMSYGLPCIVHDYEISRFILGDKGYYCDLTREGNLTKCMTKILQNQLEVKQASSLHAQVYEHFSWDKLKPKYVELFQYVASMS